MSFLASCVLPVADREVNTRDLQLVSRDVGNDWKFLGRLLGCSDAVLDNLQHDFHQDGQREMAYQMLRHWHEECGSDAKLAKLAKALVDVKRPHIALKLQDVPRQ